MFKVSFLKVVYLIIYYESDFSDLT